MYKMSGVIIVIASYPSVSLVEWFPFVHLVERPSVLRYYLYRC